jgi:hypothetical protein
VAKLVLPQNNFQKGSLNKYAISTLNVQPAMAHESTEKLTFTRLNVDFFAKTKMPKPKLIKAVNARDNPKTINFLLRK